MVTPMPITLSGFVIPIPLMLQACFVKSLLWHKTSPRLLISLLAFLTVMMIISHIFLTYSFVLIQNLADLKFVVKYTNEHLYHRTVYSYSNGDWDELRDHLMDVHWLDIFKHDATYVAKQITEWIEIGIDCYIPRRKFHHGPHLLVPLPLHIATIISSSTIGMRLLQIKNCFVILAITARKSSKMRGPIMPKQLVVLSHHSLSDHVTSGGSATAFLTGGSLPYLLFLMAQRS